jgi:elongator complex protein 1
MLKQLIADIEAEKYGIAFRLLRQHKIDINLIYDVNPTKFLASISKFVSEVKQVDYLNLFINSLSEDERGKELEFMRPQKEEQLIRAQHEEFMQTQINGIATDTTATFTKVNKICDAVKEELVKINTDNKYLLPILTTYIKKQP